VSDDQENTPPVIDLDELLHPDEQSRFRRLCLETSSAELSELAGVLQLHIERVRDIADHRTDVEMAERIAVVLNDLLSGSTGFAPEERVLLRGAVEYFLLTDDADGDLTDVLGFDDDARVLNSVLDRIERPELRIMFD
jgi:hypothetical protein